MESKELALEIARIIDQKKGHDIVILDLVGLSDIADCFVIATGDNNRMVDAIVDEIENVLREKDIRPFAIEGRVDNTWALMDFGNVVVHVLQPETRAFYRLERLWGDAPRLDFTGTEIQNDSCAPADDSHAASIGAEEIIKGRLQRDEH